MATCTGPSTADSPCPLVTGAGCLLVEGADVVVSTSSLEESRQVLAAVRARDPEQAVVFEVPAPSAAAFAGVTEGAAVLHSPVTERLLLEAVEKAAAPPTP